ncbi:MAG: DUF1835 domain-containing protein [Flavobacteriaceae bacterium]|nr:DUF1835 domain-containing protein [Flavobacteriaceae bacterium]
MNKTLHILNGDSTAQIFSRSTIQGDVIIWREMLYEGSLHKDVGSDAFWKKRYAFFEVEIGVSKIEYFDKTIKELIKIEDASNYNKIVLWFEYDLFCQVNLMALCVFLLKYYRKDINYYLVCTGHEKGKSYLQTLSDYSSDKYQTLYKDKIKLTRNNLLFAKQSWELYVENNKETLKEFDFDQCSKFNYLQQAISQHLQRFPSQNGLNQIENKILRIINTGVSDRNSIVNELLLWQQKETVYGFADSQYFLYLKKLGDYYTVKNEMIILNNKGKKMLIN